MNQRQPDRRCAAPRALLYAGGAALLGLGLGCGGAAGPDPEASPGSATSAPAAGACIWGVDELLAKVGVVTSARIDCGQTPGFFADGVSAALDCFRSQAQQGNSVEFTVNDCIDCSIPSTYVATRKDGLLRVLLEADQYGDAYREARVEKCSALVYEPGEPVSCTQPAVLYSCRDRQLSR